MLPHGDVTRKRIIGGHFSKSIKFSGNSGDTVQISVSDTGEPVVWKSAYGNRAQRLQAQALKQVHCAEICADIYARSFLIPNIRTQTWKNRGKEDAEFHISMDYIPYDDVQTLVKFSDKDTLNWFIAEVLSLVNDFEVKKCKQVSMESVYPKFESKSISILDAIRSNGSFKPKVMKVAERALATVLELGKNNMTVLIPEGFCHGDLTFSNILVNGKSRRIAAFDFLDSFVESPLQDIAKIRQDTSYYWVCESDNTMAKTSSHVWNRLYITLSAFDEIVMEYIAKQPWSPVYPMFEICTLCRILPYCKSDSKLEWCLRSITKAVDFWTQGQQVQHSFSRFSSSSEKGSNVPHSNPTSSSLSNKTVNLVIVAAATGNSSRYPNSSIPKWVNRLPTGKLMITESFAGVSLYNVNRIIVVVQQSHIDTYFGGMTKILVHELKTIKQLKSFDERAITIVALPGPTSGQINSAVQAISNLNLHGALFLKDVHCSFEAPSNVICPNYNGVIYYDISFQNDTILYNIGSKNFIELQNDDVIGNIVEKKVISDKFGVGGYMFADVKEFLDHANFIKKLDQKFGNLPIRSSDLIWSMIIRGNKTGEVMARASPSFNDFSTLQGWQAHWVKCSSTNYQVSSTNSSSPFGSPPSMHPSFVPKIQLPLPVLQNKRRFHVVMPMGGLGSRFAADPSFQGLPKPLIPIDGQPMFLKCLSSLEGIKADIALTIIFRREHEEQFGLSELILAACPDANIVIIPHLTKGAVETFLACRSSLLEDDAVLICDCDLWFDSDEFLKSIESILSENSKRSDTIDGLLLSFNSDNPRYSYAKMYNDSLFISKTKEKVVVSNHALCGAYFFSRADKLLICADKLMASNLEDIGLKEYYCSALYNVLLGLEQEDGEQKVDASNIPKALVQVIKLDSYASFGTPQEYFEYKKNGAQVKHRDTMIH